MLGRMAPNDRPSAGGEQVAASVNLAGEHSLRSPARWSIKTKLVFMSLVLSVSPVLLLGYLTGARAQGAFTIEALAVALAAAVVSGALSMLVAKSITRQLRHLTRAAEGLALGYLDGTAEENETIRRYFRAKLAAGEKDAAMVKVGPDERVSAARRRLAQQLAANPLAVAAVVGTGDTRRASEFLAKVQDSDRHLTGVFILDSTGRCVAAADPKMVGRSYDFRPYFQHAMRGETYTSDISLSIDTFSPQVVHTAPVVASGGRPVGVLAVRSDARQEFPYQAGLGHDEGWGVVPGDEVSRLRLAILRVRAYMTELVMVTDRVAGGDLCCEAPIKAGSDILGIAVNHMVVKLRSMVGQLKDTAETLSMAAEQLGEATVQADGAVQQMIAAVRDIASASQEVSKSAQTTSSNMTGLSRAVGEIAVGASEQTRQVQDAAAAVTAMADRVSQVAGNAGNLAAAGEQARASAREGAAAVQQTAVGMAEIKQIVLRAASRVEELGKLGNRIGAVVDTIDEIAEQTNLLALNAAIEAARAGEHGAGFAVVADEVRKLAERSQKETRAIADLIKEVQAGTREAVSVMQAGSAGVEQGSARAEQATKALADITEAVESTVKWVSEIAAAAQEMAASAESVVGAVRAIDRVAQDNRTATQTMASQAEAVTSAAAAAAAVAEQNSASAQEVHAVTEELTARVKQVGAQARKLSTSAEELSGVVARFRLPAPARKLARSA